MLRQPSEINNLRGTELARLRREWGLFILAAIVMAGSGYGFLQGIWEHAGRWVTLASLVAGYEVWVVWRGLERNHRKGEANLLPTLGLGNWLTLTRGLLLAGLAGFLFSPWPEGWLAWLPGGLYITSDVLDYLDGFAARSRNHATRLGEYLDLELDAAGILIAPLLGILYGQLPIWYLSVSLARYLFVAGLWVMKRQGKPIYDLTPSPLRRALAGFQMGFIAVVLLPIYRPPGTWLAASVWLVPFLVNFVRDWLVVSGGINPQSQDYQRVMKASQQVFAEWLPVLLRISAALLGVWAGLEVIDHNGIVEGFLFILTSMMIAAGAAARLAALALLLLTGWLLPIEDMSTIALIVGSAAITLLGSGSFSLWRPEEPFLTRHLGGKSS